MDLSIIQYIKLNSVIRNYGLDSMDLYAQKKKERTNL